MPWEAEELRLTGDYFALAGGVVLVRRPTLADHRFGCVAVAASTSGLVDHRVGNREWGLRPRTPPPAEIGVVAHDGTADGVQRGANDAFGGWIYGFHAAPTRCWAGGLGVRAQAPFALATETARRLRC